MNEPARAGLHTRQTVYDGRGQVVGYVATPVDPAEVTSYDGGTGELTGTEVTGYIDLFEVVAGDVIRDVICDQRWSIVKEVSEGNLEGVYVVVTFVGQRHRVVATPNERRVPIRELGRRDEMPTLYATPADAPG